MFPVHRNIRYEGGSCFAALQNGVVDYGSGVPSEKISKSSSTDVSKRPLSLEVSSANGYPVKNIRDNSEGLDEGSLPCTPELMSDSELDVSGCSAGDEVLEAETKQLVLRFLTEQTGLTKPQWNESRALSTMKRVVGELLDKHRYTFNGMMNRLLVDDKGDDISFVHSVATTLFADGITNWGRVASLVAFGAAVCERLKQKHQENCVELVGQEICSYLLSKQRDWLLKNNSWDGFVDFFRVSDTESTVMKSLMAVAGVAGIGALALLIR